MTLMSPNGGTGNELIGTGWSWPVASDGTGGISLVSGVADLEQAMYLILSTHPGERPMRPEFGCRLRDFVFEPADATTAGLIGHEVRTALTRWEPRVQIEEVVVTTDGDDPSTLWIEITFTVLATYDRRNLVFPFYVIPDHDE
jgi:phage baseplate assembly protein W